MSAKSMVGLALVIVGIVALVWGGVFWKEKDTILDAGPLQVTTTEHKGIAIPGVAGVISLVGGILLLVVSERKRA